LTESGRETELDGGLLIVLPDVDRGGVDGEYEPSDPRTFVSRGRRVQESLPSAAEGFDRWGCGDAMGVMAIVVCTAGMMCIAGGWLCIAGGA
jgi:hypothetical protein